MRPRSSFLFGGSTGGVDAMLGPDPIIVKSSIPNDSPSQIGSTATGSAAAAAWAAFAASLWRAATSAISSSFRHRASSSRSTRLRTVSDIMAAVCTANLTGGSASGMSSSCMTRGRLQEGSSSVLPSSELTGLGAVSKLARVAPSAAIIRRDARSCGGTRVVHKDARRVLTPVSDIKALAHLLRQGELLRLREPQKWILRPIWGLGRDRYVFASYHPCWLVTTPEVLTSGHIVVGVIFSGRKGGYL
jgi:hypothetical protein